MSTDTMASIAEHLEFLGYRCEAQDDGWTFAVHPTRPDFFARVLPLGVRLVALFTLNDLDDVRRGDWLWFANRCNEAGLLVKFALVARDEGGYVFRATAYGPLAYERADFGAFMDVWHRDLTLMEHAPPVGQASERDEADDGEEEEGVVGKAQVTH